MCEACFGSLKLAGMRPGARQVRPAGFDDMTAMRPIDKGQKHALIILVQLGIRVRGLKLPQIVKGSWRVSERDVSNPGAHIKMRV